MRRTLLSTALILTLFFLSLSAFSVQASMPDQAFATPTPGADGRIIYIVQSGESCSLISTKTGVPVNQLRSLNRLDDACTLQVGQELLLGIAQPVGSVTDTPEALQATLTPAPTPTPSLPDATICVLLYNDVNGDALRQDSETSIPRGAISVSGTSGQYSQTNPTTDSADPVCFEKIFEGTYNISVAAPEGYNPTTQLNYTLDIKSGEQIYVDFGAQVAGQSQSNTQNTTNNTGETNLFGVAGAILITAALGLGIYAWLVYGRKPKL